MTAISGIRESAVESGSGLPEFAVAPDCERSDLCETVAGIDHEGRPVECSVVHERPLTIFLNDQEIVTAMTIGDHLEWLAVGYLRNQGIIGPQDTITGCDYLSELETIVVRTAQATQFEAKRKKRIRTSGCAQGTIFSDVMDSFDQVHLSNDAVIRTSWIYALIKKINLCPSLYLKAGAIHGCVLGHKDRPLVYVEDVGRHNAVDKIAGWMFLNNVAPDDKIFYTTGRLTSEMILKCVMMGVPVLVSRSGFTARGVSLARQAGLTLIGRARGRRFVALSGQHRLIFDAEPERFHQQ